MLSLSPQSPIFTKAMIILLDGSTIRKSQARAQSELRSMIKQYDEMLHKNWELATDEQKARIEQIRSQTAVQDEKRNRGSDAAAAIVENMQTLAEILKNPQPNRNIEDYEE